MNSPPRVSLGPFPPEGGPVPGSVSCPLLFSFQQVQLTGACQSHVVVLCELSLGVLTVWAASPFRSSFAKQLLGYPWAQPTSLFSVRC